MVPSPDLFLYFRVLVNGCLLLSRQFSGAPCVNPLRELLPETIRSAIRNKRVVQMLVRGRYITNIILYLGSPPLIIRNSF
jgi:hypothetical protein